MSTDRDTFENDDDKEEEVSDNNSMRVKDCFRECNESLLRQQQAIEEWFQENNYHE